MGGQGSFDKGVKVIVGSCKPLKPRVECWRKATRCEAGLFSNTRAAACRTNTGTLQNRGPPAWVTPSSHPSNPRGDAML
jgi:hypothetical protein